MGLAHGHRAGGPRWRSSGSASRVELTSSEEPAPALVDLDIADPRAVEPAWARYVAGVVAVVRPEMGAVGTVSTTLPVGAGLSSSAALEVAVALALGFEGTPHELALACQQAEHRASGVPSGVMDQLASAAGPCRPCPAHGLRRPGGDTSADARRPRRGRRPLGAGPCPRRLRLRRAPGGVRGGRGDHRPPARCRRATTWPASKTRCCGAGPATSSPRTVGCSSSPTASGWATRPAPAGSWPPATPACAQDFDVSTPALDALVAELSAVPGVYGARLTGAGFGGCVVALADAASPVRGWRLHPSPGATTDRSG